MTINLAERIQELREQQGAPSAPAGYDLNTLSRNRADANDTPAASVRGTKLIPNRYAGKCVRCDSWVGEGEGNIKKVEGRWLVAHNGDCPSPAGPRERGYEQTVPAPEKPIRHGIYTVEGDQGHATFRIRRQADDAEFAPGKDVIGVMLGSDNTRFTSIGFVNNGRVILFKRYQQNPQRWQDYLVSLIADPDAALESLKCRRCFRDLTTPESLESGIGPVCATLEEG